MVRKIFFVFLLLIGLFTLTSCGTKTPFPHDEGGDIIPQQEIKERWLFNDGQLVERLDKYDHMFYWENGRSMDYIIGPVNHAEFVKRQGDNLLFISHGTNDTAKLDIPYRTTFEVKTGKVTNEQLSFNLEESICFGNQENGWVISDFSWNTNELEFYFTHSEYTGWFETQALPYIETFFDKDTNSLHFYIFGTKINDLALSKIDHFSGNNYVKIVKATQDDVAKRTLQFNDFLQAYAFQVNAEIVDHPAVMLNIQLSKGQKYSVSESIINTTKTPVRKMTISFQ